MPVLGAFSQNVAFASGPSSGFVHDLSIRQSTKERITECKFTVENDPVSGPTFDACVIGERITVTQSNNGFTFTFEGEIFDVSDERGTNWTQRTVTAYSDEEQAKWVRFQEQWNNVRADTIISDLWNTYGGGIAPGGISVDSNDQRLTLSSSFDSLFDMTEEVCKRTAWAWRIDASTGVMEFFDPLARNSKAFDQSDNDIEGGTLQVSRNSKHVTNVARTQAWIYRTRTQSVQALAKEDCVKAVRAHKLLPPPGWELVGEPIITDDIGGSDFDRDVELTEDGWLRFDPPIIPETQATAEELFLQLYVYVDVQVRWRRKVWLVLEASGSITEYGRREGQPISDDGGQEIEEAEQRLTEFLARNAFPKIDVSGSAVSLGYAPDTICNVSLVEPPLSAPLYVTTINHTTEGNDLRVEVEFASPDTVLDTGSGQRPSTAEIDVVHELHRRIIQLERRDAHPLGVLGITTAQVGQVKPATTVQDGWGWAGEFNVLSKISDTNTQINGNEINDTGIN